MRIKTITYSDVWQKPCQFYWRGLLRLTIGVALPSRAMLIGGRIVEPEKGRNLCLIAYLDRNALLVLSEELRL